MNFNRLLSNPLVVAGLQSGALLTTRMQKDRDEEEALRREMALKSFEYQQRNLDATKSREQQLADLAESRKYNEGQQRQRDLEQRYRAGIGSQIPAEIADAQNVAIEQGDADKLATATDQGVENAKLLRQQQQEKTLADGKTLLPAGKIEYYGTLAKNNEGTELGAKAALLFEAAKAEKTDKDQEAKKWEADNSSIQRVQEFKVTNPNATLDQKRAWGKGLEPKLTAAGWTELQKFDPVDPTTKTAEQTARAMASTVVRAEIQKRAGGDNASTAALIQALGEPGTDSPETLTKGAGAAGVDVSGLSDLYWKTYREFTGQPAPSASGGSAGAGQPAPMTFSSHAPTTLLPIGQETQVTDRMLARTNGGQPPGSPAPAPTGQMANTPADTTQPQSPALAAYLASQVPATGASQPNIGNTGAPQLGRTLTLDEQLKLPRQEREQYRRTERAKARAIADSTDAVADSTENANKQMIQRWMSQRVNIQMEIEDRVAKGEDLNAAAQAVAAAHPDLPTGEILKLVDVIQQRQKANFKIGL